MDWLFQVFVFCIGICLILFSGKISRKGYDYSTSLYWFPGTEDVWVPVFTILFVVTGGGIVLISLAPLLN